MEKNFNSLLMLIVAFTALGQKEEGYDFETLKAKDKSGNNRDEEPEVDR